MRSGHLIITVTLAVVLLAVLLHLTHWSAPVLAVVRGKKTVEQRLEQYGPAARERMRRAFAAADAPYPPERAVLLAVKDRRRLEVYAPDRSGQLRRVVSHPILAASGTAGPKLRRGDRQVPEGVYGLDSLNPNSRFHLSLRLNYPNAFDQKMAAADGRGDLGGDIMIHGKDVSVGCLAMGDPVIEELFVLAADCGIERVRVIIVPTDFRRAAPVASAQNNQPHWVTQLYDELAVELSGLRD